MRATWAVALVLFGLTMTAATPSPSAEADAVLEQAKAASGGAAWDQLQGWHESGVVHLGKGDLAYDAWAETHRLAMLTKSNRAGKPRAEGFDGRTSWSIDADGRETADLSAAAISEARQGSYFGMYGFFFPKRFPAERTYLGARTGNGVTYDVVEVAPLGGRPEALWIDRNTHLLSAVVSLDKDHPMTTFLGDFKVAGALRLPFAVQQGADAAHQVVRQIAAYDFAPVPAQWFAPPVRR